ncbi:hypothetical protein BSPLISOX_436 [uncultured Gammaproteobacteria bacterium]|nr:hypothetical protein BSPLISOX_436 [uncultured Gammaproteobacteria bacterium]
MPKGVGLSLCSQKDLDKVAQLLTINLEKYLTLKHQRI